jgi:hypothetical protein
MRFDFIFIVLSLSVVETAACEHSYAIARRIPASRVGSLRAAAKVPAAGLIFESIL